MRILIVDDSRATLEIVRRALEQFGYRNLSIRKANNAVEALKVIGQWNPVIVLTDWHMPDISGLTLLAEIKKRQMGIKVAMITTVDDDEQIKSAIDAGANFVLCKPFTDEDLHDKLLPLVQMAEQSLIIEKSMTDVQGELALPKLNQLEKVLHRTISDQVVLKNIHTQHFDESKVPCLMAMYVDADTQRVRSIALLDIYAACIYARSCDSISKKRLQMCIKAKKIDPEMLGACQKVLADSALAFIDYRTKVSLRFKGVNFIPSSFKKLESLYEIAESRRIDFSCQLGSMALGTVTLVGF